LGFAAGYSLHQRPRFSQQFDCDAQASCQGVLRRSMIRGQLVAGAKGVFSAALLRMEWVSPLASSASPLPFSEEGMGILGKASGDRLMTFQGTLGYRLTPAWSAGTQLIHCSAAELRNTSAMTLLFVNHLRGNASYVLGAGNFRSSSIETGFAVAAFVTVNVRRPIGLM
jgi:hypothetical protein